LKATIGQVKCGKYMVLPPQCHATKNGNNVPNTANLARDFHKFENFFFIFCEIGVIASAFSV
jgi:hypothetical protein